MTQEGMRPADYLDALNVSSHPAPKPNWWLPDKGVTMTKEREIYEYLMRKPYFQSWQGRAVELSIGLAALIPETSQDNPYCGPGPDDETEQQADERCACSLAWVAGRLSKYEIPEPVDTYRAALTRKNISAWLTQFTDEERRIIKQILNEASTTDDAGLVEIPKMPNSGWIGESYIDGFDDGRRKQHTADRNECWSCPNLLAFLKESGEAHLQSEVTAAVKARDKETAEWLQQILNSQVIYGGKDRVKHFTDGLKALEARISEVKHE